MDYLSWVKEQTQERQDLSILLLEASSMLGKALCDGDKDAAATALADVRSLYKQIGEMDV
jgi:hypothetical protein